MEPTGGKPSFLRNILVRLFLFCVFVIALRFAYVVTIRGESCDVGDFCFLRLTGEFQRRCRRRAADEILVGGGYFILRPILRRQHRRKFLIYGQRRVSKNPYNFTPPDVFALREIGVEDSIGISKKGFKPLVISGQGFKQPFGDETFDFVFCGGGVVEKSVRPGDFVAEIWRTLKPEGFCFESLLGLFNFCRLVKSRDIGGFDSKMPFIREIILQKFMNKCSVPSYKQELIRKAEPLIEEEPKKPWITLKKNAQKIKYLPSMVDISFKSKYVYVDVGARSYGSSIVSWFKKQYPKQNKTFEIYAIEADKTFHAQYKNKKGVTLLPYAAWVRNETLFFEINEDPGHKEVEKGRGMGRIQPVQSSGGSTSSGDVDQIQGFDFADWLKNTVSERDYVVMKMDVEGTEFDLIPRLFENGAICLIDELFLECHYNRWQKCCPGERTTKYQKTYGQCLNLFASLRKSGVLVHQWW
ncbi:hypothetical protein Pfo_029042 [Paulownia fortunei]|nr:hypothetical protein Pfo_029042 [Paulownia fortunei]